MENRLKITPALSWFRWAYIFIFRNFRCAEPGIAENIELYSLELDPCRGDFEPVASLINRHTHCKKVYQHRQKRWLCFQPIKETQNPPQNVEKMINYRISIWSCFPEKNNLGTRPLMFLPLFSPFETQSGFSLSNEDCAGPWRDYYEWKGEFSNLCIFTNISQLLKNRKF